MIIQDNNLLVLQNANQIDGNRIYYCDSRVIEWKIAVHNSAMGQFWRTFIY